MNGKLVVAVLLFFAGCSQGAPPAHVVSVPPVPAASAPVGEAVAKAPDDPRVVCPVGTTQKQDEGFGIRMVWCVDADNRHHGPLRKWWSNGNMAAEMTYVHGDLDGPSRRWHENGQLAFEGSYRAGKPEGKLLLWHPNGRKQSESFWRDGEPVGADRRWDPSGKPEPVEK